MKNGVLKKVLVLLMLLFFSTALIFAGGKQEEEAEEEAAAESVEPAEEEAEETAAQTAKEVLVYGTTEKVSDMDPANAYDFHTWELFRNISRGLLAYKPGTTQSITGMEKEN